MARPPLPIGSWGRISSRVLETDDKGKPVKVRAKANFRDHDGHVRDVSAYGKTATAAESALLKKLQDRAKTSQSGDLTAMHKLTHLLDLWEDKFEDQIADGRRSPTSLDTYRSAIKFRAPGVDIPIGLGIGRIVFRALNRGEIALALVALVAIAVGQPTGPVAALTAAVLVILAVQLVAVRPRLNRRTDRVLAGQLSPRSTTHLYYVGLEVTKVLTLAALGICLLVER